MEPDSFENDVSTGPIRLLHTYHLESLQNSHHLLFIALESVMKQSWVTSIYVSYVKDDVRDICNRIQSQL